MSKPKPKRAKAVRPAGRWQEYGGRLYHLDSVQLVVLENISTGEQTRAYKANVWEGGQLVPYLLKVNK